MNLASGGLWAIGVGITIMQLKSVLRAIAMTKMRNLVGNCHLIGDLLLVIR
jgi:hypothetical protein